MPVHWQGQKNLSNSSDWRSKFEMGEILTAFKFG